VERKPARSGRQVRQNSFDIRHAHDFRAARQMRFPKGRVAMGVQHGLHADSCSASVKKAV
jgi:hypothetical protein